MPNCIWSAWQAAPYALSSTRYAPRDFISVATSNMMRVTADTPGVAPAEGTDQSLYSDCSGMCRLRREGLAASSWFKGLYPYSAGRHPRAF